MGWLTTHLRDVAQEFISGGTPSTKIDHYWSGDIPWVTGADIDDNVVVAGRKWITREAVEDSATHIVPKGAVLLVTRTGVGKVATAGADIAISQDLTGIVLNERVCAEFVVAAIRHRMNSFRDLQQGAIIKGVLRKDVEELVIPLPPLSEQRRIANILDQADRLRRLRAEADAKAGRILPALFIKMFEDHTSGFQSVEKRRLRDVVVLRSGKFLSSKDMDDNGTFPVYGGNGIAGYHSEYMFDEPKVVIGRVGFYCGAVHYSAAQSWITDNALYVAEMSDDLHPRYLAEALRMANLGQYAGQSGQPLISGSRIYPVEIAYPSQERQRQFVDIAARIELLHARRQHSGGALNGIWAILLHRAFRGNIERAFDADGSAQPSAKRVIEAGVTGC